MADIWVIGITRIGWTKLFPFETTAADQEILKRERMAILDFDEQFELAKSDGKAIGHPTDTSSSKHQDAAAFEVLNTNSHYRVFNLRSPFGESRTSYFHKSVGGYHAAKLMRIQEFIDNILYDEQGKIIKSLKAGDFQINPSMAPGLAMLNAKYILVPGMDKPLVFAGALGPAWFVNEVEWVDDAQSEISGVKTLDPSRKALVHEEFKDVLGKVSVRATTR